MDMEREKEESKENGWRDGMNAFLWGSVSMFGIWLRLFRWRGLYTAAVSKQCDGKTICLSSSDGPQAQASRLATHDEWFDVEMEIRPRNVAQGDTMQASASFVRQGRGGVAVGCKVGGGRLAQMRCPWGRGTRNFRFAGTLLRLA